MIDFELLGRSGREVAREMTLVRILERYLQEDGRLYLEESDKKRPVDRVRFCYIVNEDGSLGVSLAKLDNWSTEESMKKYTAILIEILTSHASHIESDFVQQNSVRNTSRQLGFESLTWFRIDAMLD